MGTLPAAGVAVAENVMVWPLTVMLLPARPVAATVAASAFEEARRGVGENRGSRCNRGGDAVVCQCVERERSANAADQVAGGQYRSAAGSAAIQHVAAGGRVGIGGAAAQIGSGRAGDRGGDVRLGGVAHRGLQRLVGNRLRGVDQLLQRGDAGVGRLQDLHAVADAIEQVADVAGAVIEALRREIVGGIVESGIYFSAGRKTVLRGGEQIGGRLERKQVLTNRC